MSDAKKQTLAYLATPFTKYHAGTASACMEATRIAGNLFASGILVYSPIAYCAALARQHGLDMLDLSLWLPIEERMCAACDVLIVARMVGWEESEGIARETYRFKSWGRPIFDLDPQTMRMTQRGGDPFSYRRDAKEAIAS